MLASDFAHEAYRAQSHSMGAWTSKLLNRTNKNIQPFLQRVHRLYNWLLDWPSTKVLTSLWRSTRPGFVNVKFTVQVLQCSQGLWDFSVWLSQTSSLRSLLCHREWLHCGCEQVQAWCCSGVVTVAIMWHYFSESTLWCGAITVWVIVVFVYVLLWRLYLMTFFWYQYEG